MCVCLCMCVCVCVLHGFERRMCRRALRQWCSRGRLRGLTHPRARFRSKRRIAYLLAVCDTKHTSQQLFILLIHDRSTRWGQETAYLFCSALPAPEPPPALPPPPPPPPPPCCDLSCWRRAFRIWAARQRSFLSISPIQLSPSRGHLRTWSSSESSMLTGCYSRESGGVVGERESGRFWKIIWRGRVDGRYGAAGLCPAAGS